VLSGRILTFGPWTILTLHIWAALALVPILAAHLAPHRWRLLRLPSRRRGGQRVSRRSALITLGLAAAGVAAWTAANLVERAVGGVRRFTGSRWLPDGSLPPVTTFFGEDAPPIDPETWRLAVVGAVGRPLDLSLAELSAIGVVEREEVLDCTSGWALRSRWRGVPLDRVVSAAAPTSGASQVTVRSATGWYATLGMEETSRAMLATGVAGLPLPTGNGAPCRLVAPDRRGLEWVKWVTRVEVS
jgi:DMSO/TMAO reductase YedYZ molybdopterin-dependent catalytic subunit